MSKLVSEIRSVLRRRRTRRAAEKRARRGNAALNAEQRRHVADLMRRFRPVETGHDLVRIGPDFDGGYLVPDDLDGLVALYSPGVSDTTGFDLEIAERGISCFLADGTIEVPQGMHPRMSFEKMMVGGADSDGVMALESWIARTAPADGDLLLQMDIEGAEYEVITATPSDVLDRFRVIVLELHHLDEMLLGNERDLLARFMDKLQKNHVLCHLHPNNFAGAVQVVGKRVPPLLELTFLRADRVRSDLLEEAQFPHRLDMPNLPENDERAYEEFWQI